MSAVDLIKESRNSTDVVEVCAILQCLGFNVCSLDISDTNTSQEGDCRRTVVVNCQSSGVHVVLENKKSECTCPITAEDSSGFWQVSAVSGGKVHEKEVGSSLLGTIPKNIRERLTLDLQEVVKCIRDECDGKIKGDEKSKIISEQNALANKSASMTELTPPKERLTIKVDTPPRCRSLDALTTIGKDVKNDLPPPGNLVKHATVSDGSGSEEKVTATALSKKYRRQSTYTIADIENSKPRNKTSSPIQSSNKMLDSLVNAERTAETLRAMLEAIVRDFSTEPCDVSTSSLDVSKISLVKPVDSILKSQFASSPNLSNLGAAEGTSNLKRTDSVSTSVLPLPANKESQISRLRRLSPRLFGVKKDKEDKTPKSKDINKADGNKKSGLLTPKIVTPVRVPKLKPDGPSSVPLSRKYSHIKSTIPRPLSKKE